MSALPIPMMEAPPPPVHEGAAAPLDARRWIVAGEAAGKLGLNAQHLARKCRMEWAPQGHAQKLPTGPGGLE